MPDGRRAFGAESEDNNGNGEEDTAGQDRLDVAVAEHDRRRRKRLAEVNIGNGHSCSKAHQLQ